MKNYTITINNKRWGLSINNLRNGKGLSIYLGNLFVWHQAWFGKRHEVSWWDGKFNIKFPILNLQYSPKQKWTKMIK
jgi:hypothetical protein